MGPAVVPSSMEVSIPLGDQKDLGFAGRPKPKDLDAGALFVLKSRGSWWHRGYHLTTSIVAPVLLSLPFAMSLLGWMIGVMCLTLGAVVTFYSYNLLSLILEQQAHLSQRQLRFRDMAHDILGPAWGKYFVGPLQFGICYGAVVACSLWVDRVSSSYINLLYKPDGKMQLYQFITMSDGLTLLLAQVPSFHSLRHINLAPLGLCLAYSICALGGSIHIGNSVNAPLKDYSVVRSRVNRIFGAFNGITIIATTYASGIIPEIQATLAPPVKVKMFKGLCVCYSVIVTTYFSDGISGYLAFGNQSKGTILTNFMGETKPPLPTWFLLMTNIFCLLQLSAVTVVYLQPTNEVFEKKLANPKMDQFSARNVVPRLIAWSLSVVLATTVATMLPFFGDIKTLLGVFGCTCLDFILPMVFYNVAFKPSKRSFMFWANRTIIVMSLVLVGIGKVASVRQMALDAKTYRLFVNL